MGKMFGNDKDAPVDTQEEPPTEEEQAEAWEASETDVLAARIDMIEQCLAMMAHMTGQQRVLDKFGIHRWEVTKEAMQKNRG